MEPTVQIQNKSALTSSDATLGDSIPIFSATYAALRRITVTVLRAVMFPATTVTLNGSGSYTVANTAVASTSVVFTSPGVGTTNEGITVTVNAGVGFTIASRAGAGDAGLKVAYIVLY